MPEESKTAPTILGTRVWELPPLILHPFSNPRGPGVLLEGSKAALMLAGLLSGQGEDHDELRRKLLLSRYAEIRMPGLSSGAGLAMTAAVAIARSIFSSMIFSISIGRFSSRSICGSRAGQPEHL